MPSTEQVYMKALKRQISNWNTRTEDQIREIMKEFMFNETLYKEIVRTTMMMCANVMSHSELEARFGCIFADMYIIMTLDGVHISASDAWRCVADTVKYKSNNICYAIKSAEQHHPEIVEDANRRDAQTPATDAGSEEESDDDESHTLSPNTHKIQFSRRRTVTVPLQPASRMAMLLAKLASD